MAIDMLNGKVRVYNYSLSPISLPSSSNIHGIFFRGRNEDEEFVMERVPWEDIESENTKSDVFKVGRLRFHPDEEDEIYQKLGIEDRENIKTDQELIKILKNDSIENIKWISRINSVTLLQRMKALLFKIERSEQNPPPMKAVAVVTERLDELKYGLRRKENSQINRILQAEKKKQEENQLFAKLEELTKKVESLEKEKSEKEQLLARSQSALEDLLKKVEILTKQEVSTATENKEEKQKNKAGRPPKSK